MTQRSFAPTIFAAFILTYAVASAENDASPAKPEPGGNALSLDEYYGDALSRVGSFPGALVCISTKQAYVPENVTHCGSEKVYALSLEKPSAVVPLVGAAERAEDQLGGFLDKKVVVRGRHYPDKAIIAVSSIERAATAADAPDESGSDVREH